MPAENFTQHTKQAGVTLNEVMIALLVLSIGLLGLAALQTTALRLVEMSAKQLHAARLVQDMGERLRGNISGARRGDYVLPRGQSRGVSGTAQADLHAWTTRLAGLPAGSGEILPCSTTTPVRCQAGDGHVVTVYWNAARNPAVNNYRCPPQSSTDFRCFRQVIR